MRRVYMIPNIVTAFALSCGLLIIFKANLYPSNSAPYELLHTSSILFLLAAFADLVDGALARLIHAESEYGALFDSLADAVSFGVVPSVLLLKSLTLTQKTGLSFFVMIGAMVYTICGILRLVRYNVMARESDNNFINKLEFKKHFTGLPIPAAAACAVSVNLFLHSSFGVKWFPLSETTMSLTLTIFLLLLGYCMISKWKFPSLKALHLRVPSFSLVIGTVIVAIFLLYGILYYYSLVFVVVSLGYLAFGIILTIIRLILGKRSNTLKDYEPDHDSFHLFDEEDKK